MTVTAETALDGSAVNGGTGAVPVPPLTAEPSNAVSVRFSPTASSSPVPSVEDSVPNPSSLSSDTSSVGSTDGSGSTESPSNHRHQAKMEPSIIPVAGIRKVGPIQTLGVVTGSGLGIGFDPNSYVYMASACCELLHYRNAAALVGVIQAVGALAWTVAAAVLYFHQRAIDAVFALITVLVCLITLITVVLMIVGIVTERPKLLWPQMLSLIGVISSGIAMTVIAVVSMAGTGWPEAVFSLIFDLNTMRDSLGPIWPFCLAVIFDFGAAVGIWFYILVRGCYDYLLDKKYFESNPNIAGRGAVNNTNNGGEVKTNIAVTEASAK